jgi:hypothetical protein
VSRAASVPSSKDQHRRRVASFRDVVLEDLAFQAHFT